MNSTDNQAVNIDNEVSVELYSQYYEEARRLSKSELHLHLGGAWPLAYLEKIAKQEQFLELTKMLDQIHECAMDYHQAFGVFNLVGKIVNSDEKVENGVAALCQELLADNIHYVELRTGLKDMGSGFEGYLNAVLRGIDRGCKGTLLKVNLLLSFRRDTPRFVAEETIALALKYRDRGITGLDLSGDSSIGDASQLLSLLVEAKHSFPLTLHIGELMKENRDQQMLELQFLQPERIGHAVHLCPEAKQWVLDHKIPVELCITSSVKARMVQKASDNPILEWLKVDHPVTVCTDDPLIFGVSLSDEYAQVAMLTGLSPTELIERSEKIIKFEPMSLAK